MGYKNTQSSFRFADLALNKTFKHNRSIETMERIDKAINWKKIESILLSHYIPGTSNEGAGAYHPMLLYKCLLLQKWFRISSDPELENQINDRLSFKKFLRLSFETPSPDHTTFSRFRKRLSKEAMDQINSEILRQFASQRLTINEGIAVDARLVKSASSPLSKNQIKEARTNKENSENLDKNCNTLKFSRDLESDRTVKNDKPHYGLKEHASVDVNHGFILACLTGVDL
jgi:IS5 family transposase